MKKLFLTTAILLTPTLAGAGSFNPALEDPVVVLDPNTPSDRRCRILFGLLPCSTGSVTDETFGDDNSDEGYDPNPPETESPVDDDPVDDDPVDDDPDVPDEDDDWEREKPDRPGNDRPDQGGNNGWGNGDQDAPGGSGGHNNAENNSGGNDRPGNSGGRK